MSPDLEVITKQAELEFEKYCNLINSLNMTKQEARLLNAIVSEENNFSLDEYSTEVSARDIKTFVTRFRDERADLTNYVNELIKHEADNTDDEPSTRRYVVGALRLDRVAGALLHPEGSSIHNPELYIYVDDGLQLEGQKAIDIREYEDEMTIMRFKAINQESDNFTASMVALANELANEATERTGIDNAVITQMLMQQTGVDTKLSKGTFNSTEQGYWVEFHDGTGKAMRDGKELERASHPPWIEPENVSYKQSDRLSKLARLAALEPEYYISPLEPKLSKEDVNREYNNHVRIEELLKEYVKSEKSEPDEKTTVRQESSTDMNFDYGNNEQTDSTDWAGHFSRPWTEMGEEDEIELPEPIEPEPMEPVQQPASEKQKDESDPRIITDLGMFEVDYDSSTDRNVRGVLSHALTKDGTIMATEKELDQIMEAGRFNAQLTHEQLNRAGEPIQLKDYYHNVGNAAYVGICTKLDQLGLSVLANFADHMLNDVPEALKEYVLLAIPEEREPTQIHSGQAMDTSGSSEPETPKEDPAIRYSSPLTTGEELEWLLEELKDSIPDKADDDDRWVEPDTILEPGEIISMDDLDLEAPVKDPEQVARDMVDMIKYSFIYGDGTSLAEDVATAIFTIVSEGKANEAYLKLATDTQHPFTHKKDMAAAYIGAVIEEATTVRGLEFSDEPSLVEAGMYDTLFDALGIDLDEKDEDGTPDIETIDDKKENILENLEGRITEYGNMGTAELPSSTEISEYLRMDVDEMGELFITNPISIAVTKLKESAIIAVNEEGEHNFSDVIDRLLRITMNYKDLDLEIGTDEALKEIDDAREVKLNEFLEKVDIHADTLDNYLESGNKFADKLSWNGARVRERVTKLYEGKSLEARTDLVESGSSMLNDDLDPEPIAAELDKIKIGGKQEASALRVRYRAKNIYKHALVKVGKNKSPEKEVKAMEKFSQLGFTDEAKQYLFSIGRTLYEQGFAKINDEKFPRTELEMLKTLGEISPILGPEGFNILGKKYAEKEYENGVKKLKADKSAKKEIHILYKTGTEYGLPSKPELIALVAEEIRQIEANKEKKLSREIPEVPVREMMRINGLAVYSLIEKDRAQFTEMKNKMWTSYETKTRECAQKLEGEDVLDKIMNILAEIGKAGKADIPQGEIAGLRDEIWEERYIPEIKAHVEKLGDELDMIKVMDIILDMYSARKAGIPAEKVDKLRDNLWNEHYVTRAKQEAESLGAGYSPNDMVDLVRSLDRAKKVGIDVAELKTLRTDLIGMYTGGLKSDSDPTMFVSGMEALEEGLNVTINTKLYREGLTEHLEEQAAKGEYDYETIEKLIKRGVTPQKIARNLRQSNAAAIEKLDFTKNTYQEQDFTNLAKIEGYVNGLRATTAVGLVESDIAIVTTDLLNRYNQALIEISENDENSDYNSLITIVGAVRETEELGVDEDDIEPVVNEILESYTDRLNIEIGDRDQFLDAIEQLEKSLGQINTEAHLEGLYSLLRSQEAYNRDLANEIIDRGGDAGVPADVLMEECRKTIDSLEEQAFTNGINTYEFDGLYLLLDELKKIEAVELLPVDIDQRARAAILEEDYSMVLASLTRNLEEPQKKEYNSAYEDSLTELERNVSVGKDLTGEDVERLKFRIESLSKMSYGIDIEDANFRIENHMLLGLTAHVYDALTDKTILEKRAKRTLGIYKSLVDEKKAKIENNSATIGGQMFYTAPVRIGYDETGLKHIGEYKDDAKYCTTLRFVGAMEAGDEEIGYLHIVSRVHPELEGPNVKLMEGAINSAIKKLVADKESIFMTDKDIVKYLPF